MSAHFFEQVADALVGLVPAELGAPETRLSSINLKIWFGDEPREHYEAQFLPDRRFEVGFHLEHRAVERNEAVLDRLLAKEPEWRPMLGRATAGEFPGTQGWSWRRISEVGAAPRTLDIDSALDVAERLAAYAETLEPLRIGQPTKR